MLIVIPIWALFLHKASYFSNHLRRCAKQAESAILFEPNFDLGLTTCPRIRAVEPQARESRQHGAEPRAQKTVGAMRPERYCCRCFPRGKQERRLASAQPAGRSCNRSEFPTCPVMELAHRPLRAGFRRTSCRRGKANWSERLQGARPLSDGKCAGLGAHRDRMSRQRVWCPLLGHKATQFPVPNKRARAPERKRHSVAIHEGPDLPCEVRLLAAFWLRFGFRALRRWPLQANWINAL